MIWGSIPSSSGKKFFRFLKCLDWALEAIQPPVQWELGFFPQGELLSCKTDHLPPFSAKVKSKCSYTAAPLVCFHRVGKDTYVVFFLLGDSLASEFYMLMFRITLSVPSS
jgi:hypothetical protein